MVTLVRSDFTNFRSIERQTKYEERRRMDEGWQLTSTAADYYYEHRLAALGQYRSKYLSPRAYYQLVWLDANSDSVDAKDRPGGDFLRRRFAEAASPKTRQGEEGDGALLSNPVAARGAGPFPGGAPMMTAGELLLKTLLRVTSGQRTVCGTWGSSRDEKRGSMRSGGETRTERKGVLSAPCGSEFGQRRQNGPAEDVHSVTYAGLRAAEDVGLVMYDDEDVEFNADPTWQREIRGFPSNQDRHGQELLAGQDVTRYGTQVRWKSSLINTRIDVEREVFSRNSVEIPTKQLKLRGENLQRQEDNEAEHRFSSTEKERGSDNFADFLSFYEEDASETQPFIANGEDQGQDDGHQSELVEMDAFRCGPSHERTPVNTGLTRKDTLDSLDYRIYASKSTIETQSVTRKRTNLWQGGNECERISSVEFLALSSENKQLETMLEPSRKLHSHRFVPMFANQQTDIVDNPWKTEEEDDYWLDDELTDWRFCLRGNEADDQTRQICRLRRRSRIQRRFSKAESRDRLQGSSSFTLVTSFEDLMTEISSDFERRLCNQSASDFPGCPLNIGWNHFEPPMEVSRFPGIFDITRPTRNFSDGDQMRCPGIEIVTSAEERGYYASQRTGRSNGGRRNFSDGDQMRCPGIVIVTSDDERAFPGQRTDRNASTNARPSPRSADDLSQTPLSLAFLIGAYILLVWIIYSTF